MDPRPKDTIVHWQYDPQEWRQFVEFDKKKRQAQDTRQALVIGVILTVALLAFLFIGSLSAFAGMAIFAVIITAGIAVHFFVNSQRQKQMEATPVNSGGEVYITPNGISTNGVWFDWGENTPWRLTTVTPVLRDMGVRLPPNVPSYIEFRCRGGAAGRHRVKVNKKWRVPVPQGRENEARRVFEYFGKPSTRRNEFGLPSD